MAFSTLSEYKEAIQSATVVPITIGSLATVAGRAYDTWTTAPPVGTAPSTATNPTSATAGALPLTNAGSGLDWRVLSARFSSLSPGQYIVCDRQGHMGGLSGNVTTGQTVGVSASGRNSSGIGCWMVLTIYTQIGTTGTTVSVAYNDSDTVSRTTPAVVLGGTGFREAGRAILLPFDPASTAGGVTYIATATINTTATGTVGNFGISLMQPLFAILVPDTSGVVSAAGFITGSTCGGIPAIPEDACLCVLALSTSTNAIGAGALLVAETAE
ncbi:MAG: hypothetical protein IPK80_02800 [Nannocystis sp.]|nr:hypothetical protein [Nannocystis sp.]